jgi:hypothetical protein
METQRKRWYIDSRMAKTLGAEQKKSKPPEKERNTAKSRIHTSDMNGLGICRKTGERGNNENIQKKTV